MSVHSRRGSQVASLASEQQAKDAAFMQMALQLASEVAAQLHSLPVICHHCCSAFVVIEYLSNMIIKLPYNSESIFERLWESSMALDGCAPFLPEFWRGRISSQWGLIGFCDPPAVW